MPSRVIRFRNNPERIIPESFPVLEMVLSYPSDRWRGWESCLMASFLASGLFRHVVIGSVRLYMQKVFLLR
jgi:hypothetical protein